MQFCESLPSLTTLLLKLWQQGRYAVSQLLTLVDVCAVCPSNSLRSNVYQQCEEGPTSWPRPLLWVSSRLLLACYELLIWGCLWIYCALKKSFNIYDFSGKCRTCGFVAPMKASTVCLWLSSERVWEHLSFPASVVGILPFLFRGLSFVL